jgi:hypothetical protein
MNPRRAGKWPQSSPCAETLQTNNISNQTAHRYQALAAVPRDVQVFRRTTKQISPALRLG